MSTFSFIYFNKYTSEKVMLNDYGMVMDDRHYFTYILTFCFYKNYFKHLKYRIDLYLTYFLCI